MVGYYLPLDFSLCFISWRSSLSASASIAAYTTPVDHLGNVGRVDFVVWQLAQLLDFVALFFTWLAHSVVSRVWLPVVLSFWLYFRYRAKVALQQTVQKAIERGQELSPDVLDRLGQRRN